MGQKRKSGRGGTRSSGIDEDALKASGIQFPGNDQRSLEEGGRDFVMVKLGETIQPMKESFIVAHLAWKGAKKEDMVVPKAILEYRRKHNVVVEDGPEIDLDEEKAPDNVEQKSDSKTDGTAAPGDSKNSESVPSKDEGDGKGQDTDMKDSDNKDETVSKPVGGENGQDQK